MVDARNNVSMANSYYKSVSEYSQTLDAWQRATRLAALLGDGGFSNGSTGNTLSATPGSSGNLWAANEDSPVTDLLGLATPTST